MNPASTVALTFVACGLLACSESPIAEDAPSADATFDLSSDHLGESEASGIIDAIRMLAMASTKPVEVRFTTGAESLTFEITLAEPAEDYELKRIVKDEEGKWIYPEPPAEPPGDLQLTWTRITPIGVAIGAGHLSDQEFKDWLGWYSKVIGGIGERSALVIQAEADTSGARLLEVLRMHADSGLDRFLIEKLAEQE